MLDPPFFINKVIQREMKKVFLNFIFGKSVNFCLYDLQICFRVKEFEETLNNYNKEVESFKKKEVASPDEMQKNVDKLAELDKLLKEAAEDLEVRFFKIQ